MSWLRFARLAGASSQAEILEPDDESAGHFEPLRSGTPQRFLLNGTEG